MLKKVFIFVCFPLLMFNVLDCPHIGEKKKLYSLFGAKNIVRLLKCPLIKCLLFGKFFMRLWPENGRGKRNCLLIRGVRPLECPLIGGSTVYSLISYICYYKRSMDLMSGVLAVEKKNQQQSLLQHYKCKKDLNNLKNYA